MKSKYITQFTSKELLEELTIRDEIGVPTTLPPTPPIPITPYQIMLKMIEKGWKEDPREGYYDERINNIWAYLGYPNFNDDTSWCAATVNCCLKLAGYKTSESIPVARSFETYGNLTPLISKGDIAVFRRYDSSWQGHVGFVHINYKNAVVVAGGNQDNKVCFKEYSKWNVKLPLNCIRRITEKINEPDFKTLKEWGLI